MPNVRIFANPKMFEIELSMIATSKERPPLQIFLHNESPSDLTAEQEETLRLKQESNAVILCHNYQIEPIQKIADYVEIPWACQTSRSNGCRSHRFLRSSLHGRDRQDPQSGKESLLPDLGCRLLSAFDSCPAEKLADYKENNPNLYVVAYANCSAAVKALMT